MRRYPADQNYSSMLNGVRRVPQTRTGSTHTFLQELADHLPKPIRILDLNIIVEQSDDRAPCMTHAEIDQPAEIKWTFISHHSNIRITTQLPQQYDRLPLS